MKIAEFGQAYARKYQDYRDSEKVIKDKLERAENHVEALQARLAKFHKKSRVPFWMEEIINPIAAELAKLMPEFQCEVLGPFGLSSEVAVHFYRKSAIGPDGDTSSRNKELWEVPGNIASITFIPGDLDKGEILIRDETRNTGKFAKNTIGEINGMNHPSIEIPEDAGAEWLLQYVHGREAKIEPVTK